MAWIKFDKSLIDDPRVLRAAGLLCDDIDVVRSQGCKLPDISIAEHYGLMRNAVTGALCVLWAYADTHIRDQDLLPLSASDIDRLVGIEGFCDAIGPDWVLQTEEQNFVFLPGYIAKNGLVSKEKRAKSNAERQKAFRDKLKPKSRRVSNGDSNVVTLSTVTARDQDLDQDQKKKTLRHFLLPSIDGLDEAAWEKWLAYRKEIGKPLRPASQHAARQAMARLSGGQMSCVDHSIAQGWTGVFDLKVNGKAAPSQNSEALQAWDALIASGGAKRDAKIQKAIDAVGGWSRINERTTFEAPRIKAEFCRAFPL